MEDRSPKQVLKECLWRTGIIDDAGYIGGAEALADELLASLAEAKFEILPVRSGVNFCWSRDKGATWKTGTTAEYEEDIRKNGPLR